MQFDVIIGNPPYQLNDGGARRHADLPTFVKQAKKLDPRYLSLVIPSRWMAAGKCLDEFRSAMLNDTRISHSSTTQTLPRCFPPSTSKVVFVTSSGTPNTTAIVTLHSSAMGRSSVLVFHKLNEFDVFVRDERAVDILHKVLARQGAEP